MTAARRALGVVVAAAALAPAAHAERGPVAVEFDPLTTALGARNLLVHVEPAAVPRWTFGAIVFAADFPDWVDHLMSYRNRDAGFDSQIGLSGGLATDYYPDPRRQGLHLGVIAFVWNYRVARGGDVTRFANLEVLPRVGYRYFPVRRLGLYLDGFAGLQAEFRLTGDAVVDGATVRTTPVLPFGTVHLGYHF
ncbi:MAG: hypothetical protein R3B06_28200 [Kofleriaceae bacterium]